MTDNGIVIIIPAYNPDDKFIKFLQELKTSGFDKIIVVNDGSSKASSNLFKQARNEYDTFVISHAINLGQGRAYKSAFNFYLSEFNGGCLKILLGLFSVIVTVSMTLMT